MSIFVDSLLTLFGLIIFSTTVAIYFYLVLEFVLLPLYYWRKFKKMMAFFKVKIPNGICIYNYPHPMQISKTTWKSFFTGEGVYANGLYYTDSDNIIICTGHKNFFTYIATLFHELGHWTEKRLGRASIGYREYYKAKEDNDYTTIKTYLMGEIIAEKTSEVVCSYYMELSAPCGAWGRLQVATYYRKKRNLMYARDENTKLTISEWRYVITEARRSAHLIINLSKKDLKFLYYTS
jgi:hypothetical protein